MPNVGEIGQFVLELLDSLSGEVWGWIAQGLGLLGELSRSAAFGLVLLAGGVACAAAWLLQRQLIKRLEAAPRAAVAWGRLELLFSLLAPIVAPVLAVVNARKELKQWSANRKAKRRGQKPPPAAADAPGESPALLVASLGPTFLIAAIAAAVLYWLAILVEPLIHARLRLSTGYSAWQFLFLGQRPELHWLVPLEEIPYLAALLTLGFWLAVWWTLGNLIRQLFLHRDLGRNLIDDRDDERVLRSWRSVFGVRNLVEPAPTYRYWASWCVAAAASLLAWSWTFVAADLYRVRPSAFAVAFVLGLSWGIHLRLRGKLQLPPEAPEVVIEEVSEPGAGWLEVLADLKLNLQLPELGESDEDRPARAIAPLKPTREPPTHRVLSPLTLELLPRSTTEARLTEMQFRVLKDLSLMAYVHIEPPSSEDELQLQRRGSEAGEDRSGLRHRNQIVLAPEGGGKTTLALLAAANHALVHTRASLVIVRDEEQARRTYDQIHQVVEPSTARWNLRLRRIGGDFVTDLTQRIIPDLVICSLHQLVVNLLDSVKIYAPFLENVGLIVVDDVESFAGPVEIHAQLAFRRLKLRLQALAQGRDADEEQAEPLFLVLGTDSMHRTPVWVKSLCGIDAVERRFYPTAATPRRQAAAIEVTAGEEDTQSAEQQQREPQAPAAAAAEVRAGHHQRFYRLSRFETATRQPIRVAQIVEACERLKVPWHYRPCGDDRRHLGRSPLLLANEPIRATSQATDTCVVLLIGKWGDVERELLRLDRAGSAFHRFRGAPEPQPEPIAMIMVGDPDEERALGSCDPATDLGRAIASLPRPIIRPPSGRTTNTHLAADLLQHWTEVEDVVTTFGSPTAHRLRSLLQEGLLVLEERVDVKYGANEYEPKVYVRALASAVSMDEERAWREGVGDKSGLLAKVSQVELVSERITPIRDRTNLNLLSRVDADSSGMVYYPGRIFEDARGRFMVVGRAAHEGTTSRKTTGHDAIEVEPLLTDDMSSPRRQIAICSPQGNGEPDPLTLGHPLLPREPLLIGNLPLDIELNQVEVRITPIATFRLAPITREIRQKKMYGAELRQRYQEQPLRTIALALYPKPGDLPEDFAAEYDLRFAGARLIAAVMRMLLPTIYRGARDSIEVALRVRTVDGAPPTPDHRLGKDDGFFLFDLHAGGNGTARAIYRDGIELLLRLCRLVIEEIVDHERIRALYDHWGDPDEIQTSAPEAGGADARDGALDWLNGRLQPEATVPEEAEAEEEPAAAADDHSANGEDALEQDQP